MLILYRLGPKGFPTDCRHAPAESGGNIANALHPTGKGLCLITGTSFTKAGTAAERLTTLGLYDVIPLKKRGNSMRKAARVTDRNRRDKDGLNATHDNPDVFINGEAAVHKGKLYQKAALMNILFIFIFLFLLFFSRLARANNFGQASVMSQCPQGGAEAEEIYQEARMYWLGQEGYRKNVEKAEELFEKAMFMGNSKAPLGIGGIYLWDYRDVYDAEKRLSFVIRMYNEGIKMGCAEGHVLLAECYFNGWGVPIDVKKALEQLRHAVNKESPKGMEVYGDYLVWNTNKIEEGRELLRRSLSLGNGDAGLPLANSYLGDDDDRMYAALRIGSRLGSMRCLRRLAHFYLEGDYGQSENEELSECAEKVRSEINWFYAPKPIEDFDKRCPHPTPLTVEP
jgi:TPR repeat protein